MVKVAFIFGMLLTNKDARKHMHTQASAQEGGFGSTVSTIVCVLFQM